MRDHSKEQKYLVVATLLLACGVFAFDLRVPLGVAGGVPYVAVVLLTLWVPGNRITWGAAVLSTVLTALGYVLSPEGGVLWVVLLNRTLAVFAIWVAAAFTLERKRLETTLREHGEILDNMREGVQLTRASDSVIVYSNPQFNSLFGYEEGELIGKHVSVLNAPSVSDPLVRIEEITDRLDQTGSWSGEIKNVKKDGTEFWCHITVSGFSHPDHGQVWLSVHADITDHKGAVDALRQSEERYRAVVATANDAIVTIDADGIVLSFNRAGEEVFGYQASEVIGRNVKMLMPDPHKSQHDDYLQSYLDGGEAKIIGIGREVLGVRKDATFFPMELSVSEIRHGDRTLFAGILRDITERLKSEEALRESEEWYRALFKQSADPTVLVDAETLKLVEFNEAAPKAFGYSHEEFKNLTVPDLEVIESAEEVAAHEDRILSAGSDSFDTKLRTKLGEVLDIHVSTTAVSLQAKKYLLGVWRNVTEIRRAEEELRRSEAGLAEAQRITHLGNWDLNIVANEVHWSDEVYRIFGLRPGEFGANHEAFMKAVHPDDQKYVQDSVDAALDDKKPYNIHHRIVLPDGGERVVHEQALVTFNEEGKPVRIVGTVQDVTERKKAEEELKEYAEAQNVLLAEVNHRVKNNLAAIISMLHLEVDRAKLTDKSPYRSLLSDLVNRIHGLSTVHSLLAASAWRPLVLSELCDRVVRSALRGVSPSKSVELTVTSSPVRVSSDHAHHLTLILNELATNTLKHALCDREVTHIDIDIRRTNERIQLVFRDEGPGYPRAFLDGDFSSANIGFELIHGIVKRNLRGEVDLRNEGGAVTVISFHEDSDFDDGEDPTDD